MLACISSIIPGAIKSTIKEHETCSVSSNSASKDISVKLDAILVAREVHDTLPGSISP